MAGNRDRSTRVKLWIALGLFVGLIIGLIVYEVNVYIKAKEQRENFEKVYKFEEKFEEEQLNTDTVPEESEEGLEEE